MSGRLWEVKNNHTKKIAGKGIGKIWFVFEMQEDFLRGEWKGLFISVSHFKNTCNTKKEVNEVGV